MLSLSVVRLHPDCEAVFGTNACAGFANGDAATDGPALADRCVRVPLRRSSTEKKIAVAAVGIVLDTNILEYLGSRIYRKSSLLLVDSI